MKFIDCIKHEYSDDRLFSDHIAMYVKIYFRKSSYSLLWPSLNIMYYIEFRGVLLNVFLTRIICSVIVLHISIKYPH